MMLDIFFTDRNSVKDVRMAGRRFLKSFNVKSAKNSDD